MHEAEAAVREAAAMIRAGAVALVVALDEFDRRGLYKKWMCESTIKWLTWQCEMAPETAREYLRIARALRDLPLIREAMLSRVVSYSRVRAITRVASSSDERSWLDKAKACSAPILERLVREERDRRAVEDPARQKEEQFLRTRREANGMLRVEALLPTMEGDLFVNGLDAAGRAAPVSTEMDDLKGASLPDRRRAEALITLSRAFLSGKASSATRPRHLVFVHLDAASGTARSDHGTQLSRETMERILEDATIVGLMKDPAGHVAVGRARHTIPPSTRRAVELRDRKCRFPGCNNSAYLDVHHKVYGGTIKDHRQSKLVLLCSWHHDRAHEHDLTFELDDENRMQVRTRDGRVFSEHAGFIDEEVA